MDVNGGREVVAAFDPAIEELSEGMLWILINGKVCYQSVCRSSRLAQFYD